MPGSVKMAIEIVEAQEEVARHDYAAAESRLKRVYELALPDRVMERSTASLLNALVALKLGRPQIAAELVPDAVRHIGSLRTYANPVERAYLKYAGRLILEEATDLMGTPMTLDVGVDYDDLDSDRVRGALRNAFPVYRSRYADAPPLQ
jgi:hypothetical protein